jgi:hypothetical protein
MLEIKITTNKTFKDIEAGTIGVGIIEYKSKYNKSKTYFHSPQEGALKVKEFFGSGSYPQIPFMFNALKNEFKERIWEACNELWQIEKLEFYKLAK